ncbi:pH-response regulator protein palA/rim20 [Chytridiales sp. JEL 0842]|nr:pH-response regulator protein palA/rim20 [Chytridiales sp. JEL 0842]
MFEVSFKRPEDTGTLFTTSLATHIATAYNENPQAYNDDLRGLEACRQDTIALDRQEASLAHLVKYYLQLSHVGLKFPIDENNLRILFTWRDVYGKEKVGKTVSSLNLSFEKASVLFNIGAMFTQLAKDQSNDSIEGIKKACVMLQNASGCFKEIKESFDPKIASSADFQPSVLDTLIGVTLAEAQEKFLQKAILDKMKDNTIARLAMAVGSLYEEAEKSAVAAEGVFPQFWVMSMSAKAKHMYALANERKARETLKEGKYGEEVARLKNANLFLQKALEQRHVFPAVLEEIKAYQLTVKESLQRAEKDNDMIYMEIVPPSTGLAEIQPAVMVKSAFQPETWLSMSFKPLFAGLIPFEMRKAISTYTDRKDRRVREEIEKLEDSAAICQGTLVSLNLPASIEASESHLVVPESTQRRLSEVRIIGGVNHLNRSWENLITVRERVSYALDAAVKILDDEERDDLGYRSQYQEKWTRISSRELTQSIRQNANAYREKLVAAKKSDQIIRNKIDSNLAKMVMLSGSPEEIERNIPSLGPFKQASNLIVATLKKLLVQLQKNMDKRPGIILELRELSKSDNFDAKLTEFAAKSSTVNYEELYSTELQKYDQLCNQVAAILKEQDEILKAINESNDAFVKWKAGDPNFLQREKALKDIDEGAKLFMEVSSNLTEGLKFYNEFENVVSRFASSCRDFALSRQTDQRDLITRLNQMSLFNQRPSVHQAQAAPWDGNINFSYSSAPFSSVPPPLQPPPPPR